MADETPPPETGDTPSPSPPPPPPPPPAVAAEGGELPDAVKAVLAKERKTASDATKALKAAERERDELRRGSMTELDRALDEARTEARAETVRELGGRLVDAEVRAAVAGRSVDVDALLEGLDRTRFLGASGDPDRDAITAWVDRIAPPPDPNRPGSFDLGQGVRTTATTPLDPRAADIAQIEADIKSARSR